MDIIDKEYLISGYTDLYMIYKIKLRMPFNQ